MTTSCSASCRNSLDTTYAAVADPEEHRRLINTATTAFYGNLYFWINLVGLLLQGFIVSRILRYAGFAHADAGNTHGFSGRVRFHVAYPDTGGGKDHEDCRER